MWDHKPTGSVEIPNFIPHNSKQDVFILPSIQRRRADCMYLQRLPLFNIISVSCNCQLKPNVINVKLLLCLHCVITTEIRIIEN